MKHEDLCKRAAAWLRGSERCDPVLYGIASTAEIPDAIGWCSSGSIVVECKVSREDFMRDKAKNHAANRMGDKRYFMVPAGLVSLECVEKHFPDHGLLEINGRRVMTTRFAPMRPEANLRREVRYLRFALIHARSNLLKVGCSVDMAALCQFFGEDGICLPAEKRPFYRAQPLTELTTETGDDREGTHPTAASTENQSVDEKR